MNCRSKRYMSQKNSARIYFAVFCSVLLSASLSAQFPGSETPEAPYEGLRYDLKPDKGFPFSTSGIVSPLLLPLDQTITKGITYDDKTNSYIFTEKIGELDYRPSTILSFDEFQTYQNNQFVSDYWQEKASLESGVGPSFLGNFRLSNQNLDRVFGTDAITITPTGSAELIFGYTVRKNENPAIPVQNRKTGSFVFKSKIEMNVTGKIGDKVELGLSYNTDATFDFENKTKLQYAGKEDDIIKKIEVGDVNFSVPGSLISGSQSLFGIKTELQFGRLTVSGVVSHQRGESSSINVQGGAQQTEFEIDVDEYDANRHFFLSHFFRDHYNEWLKNLPHIESQVTIQQIEVWVLNKQNDFTQVRNVVALMDLAEGYGPEGEPNFLADPELLQPSRKLNQPADNRLNGMYPRISSDDRIRKLSTVEAAMASYSQGYDFEVGRDFYLLESARPLSDREFTVNRELGYISLNSPLRSDEILAVAYVYTYKGVTYSVGEVSTSVDAPKALVVKLLKGTTQTPRYPTFDLMMKNIYSLGAYQLGRDGFILNVLYRNDKTGVPVNYLTEPDTIVMSPNVNRQNLLRVMRLDSLDSRNEPGPDGVFDYIDGITIDTKKGRVIFPLLEPFGSDLRDRITGFQPDNAIRNKTADKYVFEELYDSTQTKAKQIAEKNKFVLKGYYRSNSSSEIYLNAMNVPRGSVTVTAGGRILTEGQDYTVDYTLGRVKILNQGLLESGTPIKISLESNSLFKLQTKTLMGTHVDYKISDNFNVGGTVLRRTERPLTQKVNMGDEPISNTMYGFNTSYKTESQFLTTLIDKLPLIETKEPSSIAFDAEFAYLRPDQAKAVKQNDESVAYIDDFEGAQTKIELKTYTSWSLASPPKGQPDLFPYANLDSLTSGYNRAKLAWYMVDPIFYNKNKRPAVKEEDLYSHYQREVKMKELFPEKDEEISGIAQRITMFDLAYYPTIRGPYNFNTREINDNDTLLQNPRTKWGGIMREIITSDFETSNVEYIEFWMMDPYAEKPDHKGGDFYIQIGEISEDILRDSRKAFENGLPTSEIVSDVDSTVWGRVPRGQALNKSFNTDPTTRVFQDVGFDGLRDEDERSFYVNTGSVPITDLPKLGQDISADNYQYFLGGDHDQEQHSILRSYLNFNGVDGNSPTSEQNSGGNSQAAKTSPDVEDIDRDNTLNTTETYFQYHVSLRPNDLINTGDNYIVDKREISSVSNNSTPVTWYQFRIPIDQWERKVGEIEDFKSIRFIRVLLHDFEEDVVCRFATFELVRGEWRRYDYELNTAGASLTQQQGETKFEVSAVNIEENTDKEPIGYVLPPGVDRVIDPSQTQLRELNEQSILLKVENLKDNDARSVYKNTKLDLRQYKRMKMWIHAAALINQEDLIDDNEVTAFIRMGSDYQNNYYEYEMPLELSKHYLSTDTNVWRNQIDIELQEFVNIKKNRNNIDRNSPYENLSQTVYSEAIGDNHRIKVKGHPSLSDIRQIMLGIRNPGDGTEVIIYNDGEDKSFEVWFNELRLTDFNNEGGWAATGRMQTKLADLGTFSVAGSTSQPGFGGIEQKVEERQKEQINQYDISTNLQLGKFFPEKAKVSIPLYVGVSKTIINPEYFPQDPDIKFKDILENASSAEKDSLKNIAQDLTSRTSINVTNVRWGKDFKKFKIVQPSNVSATVHYSENNVKNYSLEYDNFRKYGGSLNYNYSNRAKTIQPFAKSKAFKKPAYRIIRDINFNPLPSRFSFSTDFDRTYQETKLRNVYTDIDILIDSTVSKDFGWNRRYSLNWDLTRGLRFDYSADNNSRIEEIDGAYDLFERTDNDRWKQAVWESIVDGGDNMRFNQRFNLSYTVPLNKIPLLNWTNLTASYSADYSWLKGSQLAGISQTDPDYLGNSLKNSNTIKLSANLNLRNLYNKVGYLKQLETKNSRKVPESEKQYKTVTYSKRTFFKADEPRNIYHKLKTSKIEVKVFDADGAEYPVETSIIDDNKISIQSDSDLTGVTVEITGKIEKGENPLVFIADNSLRMLIGFKNFSVTYSRNGGTHLPGYIPSTNYLGYDRTYNSPSVPFILGWQDYNSPYLAAENEWLTKNATFNSAVIFTMSENFTFRTSYEPFKGLRIDLTGMRNYGEQHEQNYYYDSLRTISPDKPGNYHGNYYFGDRYMGGSYSISVVTIATAFEHFNSKNIESAAFNDLRENRYIISSRLHNEKADQSDMYFSSVQQVSDSGYYDGYSAVSPDVVIPAFYAAYTGINPRNVTLNPFHWLVLPNWRITFDGLTRIDFFKQYFKSINLNHSYKSTYSIGSFASNLAYFESEEGFEGLVRNLQNDFISPSLATSASIVEQLSPLIGIDMTWVNSFTTKFEWRRSRNLSLSLNNNQLTETANEDYVIGAGYRFKDLPLSITTAGGTRQFKSDLNLRFDFTIRDNITIIRSLTSNNETDRNDLAAGTKKTTIGFTADYAFSDRVNVQFYYDRNANKPHSSDYFANSESNIGFSIRLSL